MLSDMTPARPRREPKATDPESPPSGPQFGAFVRLLAIGICGAALMLSVGATVFWGPVRATDEAVFDAVVPRLQAWSWLVSVSEVVTDLGAKSFTYVLAGGLAIMLAIRRRSLLAPALVGVSIFAIHVMQWLAVVVIDGPTPTEHVMGGAGPYYSGGVVRALVVFGMLATEIDHQTERRIPVWAIALTAGTIEAATRVILGRHWPFDVVMAIPIGCGLLWCYQEARRVLGLGPE